jgi:iron complex outermembrane receptor protein
LYEGTLDFKQVGSESLLDAQIGYNFETGALKGLSIAVSGTNLTDERFLLSNIDEDPYHLTKYEEYGAVYALAVSYSF